MEAQQSGYAQGRSHAEKVIADGRDPYEDWDHTMPSGIAPSEVDVWVAAYWQGVADAVRTQPDDEQERPLIRWVREI